MTVTDDEWAAAHNRLSNEVATAVEAGLTPSDVLACVENALDEVDDDA